MRKRIGLWFCRILGWHSYTHFDSFDGCSAHATCKKCGYKGLVDSLGNLFQKGFGYAARIRPYMPTKGLHWEPFTTEMGAWNTLDEARDAGQQYRSGEKDDKYVEKVVQVG